MDFGFELGDIARTLGGLMAFVVVLYIGVLFYKKESSFSDEYVLLLQQYKTRNDHLQKELEDEREHNMQEIIESKRQLEALGKKHDKEVSELRGTQAELSREVKYLRNIVGSNAQNL